MIVITLDNTLTELKEAEIERNRDINKLRIQTSNRRERTGDLKIEKSYRVMHLSNSYYHLTKHPQIHIT